MASIPFKIIPDSDPANCPPNTNNYPKVGDTNFKSHFPGINKSMAWDTLIPLIRQAQSKYVIPYACKEVFCYLSDKYNDDEESLSDLEAEALQILQDAVAFYTAHFAYAMLNGTISDMGIQQNLSSESTSEPIQVWRFKNTRWELIQIADQCLDSFLCFLEELPDTEALYAKWRNSPCYDTGSCFFRYTKEFQKYYDIKGSRRTFLAILPHIRKAEKRVIKNLLCEDLYNEVCEQIKNNDVSETNEPLIEQIRCALAYLALEIAIPSLTVCIEGDGIKTVSNTDGFNTKDPAYVHAISNLTYQIQGEARTNLADLKKFLHDNVDDYPLWKNSDCYQEEDCICDIITSSDNIGAIII